jgi:hypothetical protein
MCIGIQERNDEGNETISPCMFCMHQGRVFVYEVHNSVFCLCACTQERNDEGNET